MGLETKKNKPKSKPEIKPKKVAVVVNKPESQNQHDFQIKERQKRLDNNAITRKDTLKKLGGNNEEVDTLTKSHTRRKLRLKIAVAVRLEMRGEYAFMLKRGVKMKLGKILKLKFQQEVLLSAKPQEMSAKLYKLKLEANVLGAVLGLEGYQQKDKKKMYFGYTLQKGNLRITFLGQFAKTPDKTELAARIKVLKRLSPKVKLFADVTLDNPDKPRSLSLKSVEGTIGLALPNDQTVALYMNPGDKRFVLSYLGRF